MIPVRKPYDQVPDGLKNATEKKVQLMREGNDHKADSGTYAHVSVKNALNALYKNKCAYCERLIEEQADRRVEHFRPKKACQTKKAIQMGEQHPGYYWLTYEWPNLLLSCNPCNLAKSNQFPVVGSRVTRPPSQDADWLPDSRHMQEEQPVLINPEVDDPVDCFVFLPNGTIQAKDNNPRGDKTIKICNLNREALKFNRKKVIDDFRSAMKEQAFLLLEQLQQGFHATPEDFEAALRLGFKNIVARIQNADLASQPFSRVGWHIKRNPENFLLAGVPAGDPSEIIRAALKSLSVDQD